MSQQVITPELCEWITEQSRAGHPSESILAAMLGSGWDETIARQALARTLGQSATLTPPPGATHVVSIERMAYLASDCLLYTSDAADE